MNQRDLAARDIAVRVLRALDWCPPNSDEQEAAIRAIEPVLADALQSARAAALNIAATTAVAEADRICAFHRDKRAVAKMEYVQDMGRGIAATIRVISPSTLTLG